jgi:hypothetical protein
MGEEEEGDAMRVSKDVYNGQTGQRGSVRAKKGGGRGQVTNLATDPASIAARLGAHRAFCFGRSGFLSLLLLCWWSRGDGSPRGGGRIMHCSGGE